VYTGESGEAAWAAFQRDAAEAARHGWAPVAHQWGQGTLEVTYRPWWWTGGTSMGGWWRLPPDAGRDRRPGSVERATILAGVIGAIGGLASLVLVTQMVPDWRLVSGLNDFVVTWFWASFVCWIIGVVVGTRWQRLDRHGETVVVVLGPLIALGIQVMVFVLLLSWGAFEDRSTESFQPASPAVTSRP
jgi:hypothetical protein